MKSDHLNHGEQFNIRWRSQDLEAVREAAAASSMRVSDFVRQAAIGAARRRLARAK